jgi:hypothetical protein
MILTIGRMPETTHDGTLTTASGYVRVWDHVGSFVRSCVMHACMPSMICAHSPHLRSCVWWWWWTGNAMNVLAPSAGHPTPICGIELTRMAPIAPFMSALPAKNVITWSRDGSLRKWKLAHSSFKSKEIATSLVLDELCHLTVGYGKNKTKIFVVHNLRTKQLYVIPHHKNTKGSSPSVVAIAVAAHPAPTNTAAAAPPPPPSGSSSSPSGGGSSPSSANVIRTYENVTAYSVHKSILFIAIKTSKASSKILRVEVRHSFIHSFIHSI